MSTAAPPITFTAALPHGRQALALDAEGEAHLVLALSASEAHHLTDAWPRLMDSELHVAIVPAGELLAEDRPPRRGGRKRTTKQVAD